VPEGDSIHRAAAALRTALVGKPTLRADATRLVGPLPTPGRIVERVISHGRHLEVVWDDGLVLHTHLRRHGTWHLYREADDWRLPVADMSVELRTHDWVAVCFRAAQVETYRQFDRSRHPGFGPLAPDLRDRAADLDECANRLYHYPVQDAPVAEVLLDEHVAAGIGNVYRCEVLWATQIHPFAPVSALDGDDCADLIVVAAKLLRANLHHLRRIDTPFVKGGLAVYGRNGQRCARCGDTVCVNRSGDHGRLLYWCPGCQRHRAPQFESFDADQPIGMDPHPAASRYLHDLPWRRIDAG
jgi:endonuclease-8